MIKAAPVLSLKGKTYLTHYDMKRQETTIFIPPMFPLCLKKEIAASC
jgi:hypothetical protein